jgi:hypothetical protein
LRGYAEQAAEAHGGVGGDGAVACADFVDAALGHADGFRNFVASQSQRFDEVAQQDFAGMDRRQACAGDDISPLYGAWPQWIIDSPAITLLIRSIAGYVIILDTDSVSDA